MKLFTLIWFGQFISLMGSNITAFALGIWVFQEYGSVTQYAVISLCAMIPYIIASPIAGTLSDRWNRRYIIIFADVGAGLSTLAIAVLMATGKLHIWHVYLLAALNSAFSAFQWPAFMAATTLIVPEHHLARASGMTQAGRAVTRLMIAPVLAGVLTESIILWGILLFDFATFFVALGIMLFIRIPDAPKSKAGQTAKGSLYRESLFGWKYVAGRPELLGLFLFFMGANFFTGLSFVLFTPLILSFSSATVLGTIASVGGCGMLLGGLFMGFWKQVNQLMPIILGVAALIGCAIASVALHTNTWFIGLAVCAYFFGRTIVAGCVQVLLQKTVEKDLQGRVFAITGTIVTASLPLAYFSAGPLADYLFEPMMAVGTPLANIIGNLIPAGPGGGIRLMYMLIGIFIVMLSGAAWLYRPLWRINRV